MKKQVALRIVALFLISFEAPRSEAAPVQTIPSEGWVTAGANAERTSWVPDAAAGALRSVWVKPVEPYISQKVQIIAAEEKLFLSTARGLYAFSADTGPNCGCIPPNFPWVTRQLTRAASCTSAAWIGRAINARTGESVWTFSAAGGFHSCPLVVDGVVHAGSRDGCMYA